MQKVISQKLLVQLVFVKFLKTKLIFRKEKLVLKCCRYKLCWQRFRQGPNLKRLRKTIWQQKKVTRNRKFSKEFFIDENVFHIAKKGEKRKDHKKLDQNRKDVVTNHLLSQERGELKEIERGIRIINPDKTFFTSKKPLKYNIGKI